MGTNYFARPIKKIQETESIFNAVTDEVRAYIGNKSSIELDTVLEEWKTMKIKQMEPIHIGKSSMGWRFLFDHQNWEHFSNIEEMKEWLKNSQIESEYGQTYSFEEFWEMIEAKQKKFPSHIKKSQRPDWYIIKDGYEFSTSTDFC